MMHFLTSGIGCKKHSHNIDWPISPGPYWTDVFLRGWQQSWGMCSKTCLGLLILLKWKVQFRLNFRAKFVVLSSVRLKGAFEGCENIQDFSMWFDFLISSSSHCSNFLPWFWDSNASSMACCHRSHATTWIAKEKLSYWSSGNLLSKWLCLL